MRPTRRNDPLALSKNLKFVPGNGPPSPALPLVFANNLMYSAGCTGQTPPDGATFPLTLSSCHAAIIRLCRPDARPRDRGPGRSHSRTGPSTRTVSSQRRLYLPLQPDEEAQGGRRGEAEEDGDRRALLCILPRPPAAAVRTVGGAPHPECVTAMTAGGLTDRCPALL